MARQYPFDDEFRTARGPRMRGGMNELAPGSQPPTANQQQGQGQQGNPFYDDPFTNLLTTASMRRMGQLSQPYSDPALDEVVGLIRGRVNALQAQPTGFSPLERDQLTTRAWDGLERRRTDAKQRNLEEISRRGIGESSGVLQEMNSRTDRGFDSDRTRAEADTNIWMSQEENNRRNQQTGQLMQMAGMLADFAATRRGEQRANENDILQIATALSNLGPQRLALAMNVLNGSGGNDVSGLFNNTLNLSNSQTNANQNASAARQNFLMGLGQILGSWGR